MRVLKVLSYKGLSVGNWLVRTEDNPYISEEDFDWLDENARPFQFTGNYNIVVESETVALLVYLRFK